MGINTYASLRLLHSVTRTIAWYGLEFSGTVNQRTKVIDSFLYECMKRLFDMPIATPHRALSAEFALTPSAIQHKYFMRRIEERRSHQPPIMIKVRTHANLPPRSRTDDARNNADEQPLPYSQEIPEPGGPSIRRLPANHPTELAIIKDAVHPRSIIAYTDELEKEGRSSFAAVLFKPDGHELARDHGRLSNGKTILDAECTAIYHTMIMAMGLPTDLTVNDRETNRILRHGDSQSALHEIDEPRRSGPTAYCGRLKLECFIYFAFLLISRL